MFAASSALPEGAFLSWGWRVLFLLSIVLLGVGLFVRMKATESPLFEEARPAASTQKDTGGSTEAPMLTILRRYPLNIALAALGGCGALVLQSLLATFLLRGSTQRGSGAPCGKPAT
ncbi:MFS transporter [Streptomyces flaveolus]|uniref:hypothetical protein n=1 Tax=Streptomyces flaveolus TaxID=67297 RepID=UPI003702A54F